MSATIATCEFAKVPNAKPRPVRMSPLPIAEPGTLACQFDILATASSDASQRGPTATPRSMFWRRSWSGSMFAATASSSISCSPAKCDCGAPGARSGSLLNEPPYSGCVLASTRLFVEATL